MLIDASTAGALGLIVFGAFVVWSQLKRRMPPSAIQSSTATLQAIPPGLPLQRPKTQMQIQCATDLLVNTGTLGEVEKIRTRLGLSPANFERDVVPLLHRLTEYVQYLPASESHHHAHPGGLLQHTLEVAAHALALRQGYKLPLGASPEDQIRLSAVWSYGVLIAALLHDIGKPVADVVVQLYGQNIHVPVARWSGLAGSMVQAAETPGTTAITHYTVAFPTERDYQAHQRLPLMLLHALLSPSSMQWLATDANLMQELMAYLEGETATSEKPSAIRDIITRADSLSVATNLAQGSRIRFSTARSVPLIERLMKGLRTLLSEGLLAINRPGAAVFVDPDGVHLWIVAGVAADQTRKLLEQREEKIAGAAGLPTDNTRFFDTWAEYGSLVQPDKAFGKGSVWWVRIEIEDWSQVLTVLKFPLDKLFAAGQPRPAALQGCITPVDPKTDRKTNSDADAVHQLQPADTERSEAVFSDESTQTIPVTMEATSWNNAPVPAQIGASEAGPEFLDEAETATMSPHVRSHLGQAVQAMPNGVAAPKALFKNPRVKPQPNADSFMAWVQNGLGTGEVNFNESDAVVHFVKEGMLLVTPRAFRIYLESTPFIGSIGASKDELRALQTEIQKAGYIARNSSDKSSFHYWQVQQGDGEPGAVITTYLVPNPQAYIRPVPAPNELLKRCDAPPKRLPPKNPHPSV